MQRLGREVDYNKNEENEYYTENSKNRNNSNNIKISKQWWILTNKNIKNNNKQLQVKTYLIPEKNKVSTLITLQMKVRRRVRGIHRAKWNLQIKLVRRIHRVKWNLQIEIVMLNHLREIIVKVIPSQKVGTMKLKIKIVTNSQIISLLNHYQKIVK